jgi:hypothetical protein
MKHIFLFCTLLVMLVVADTRSAEAEVFDQRGYYMTFMRMPTFGLPAWKQMIDRIRDDGGNTVLLWTGGGFRSKKFPITWKWNEDHANVRADFVRELIDYAHTRGVKVVLALTPFAYDGVNQWPLEHPELKAKKKDGTPVDLAGIACWGYNLCPAQEGSQRFMLDYCREMVFDFYPNADGLLIESSDYSSCLCERCREKYFDHEFRFVRRISDELWAKKPDATILVYPHYFSGRTVPGLGVRSAKQPFDRRWTLFFTPHSTQIAPELLSQAESSVYWDDSPSLRGPSEIRAAAQTARRHKFTGFVPSLEGFSFIARRPEGGEQYLVGRRLKPFGFEWLADGQMPLDELLVRVNRSAVREYTRNPDLPDADFREIMRREVFGPKGKLEAVTDLLTLQRIYSQDRSWFSPSPLVVPELLEERAKREKWPAKKRSEYRAALDDVKRLAERYGGAGSRAEAEIGRIARQIVARWPVTEVDRFMPRSP